MAVECSAPCGTDAQGGEGCRAHIGTITYTPFERQTYTC